MKKLKESWLLHDGGLSPNYTTLNPVKYVEYVEVFIWPGLIEMHITSQLLNKCWTHFSTDRRITALST